MYRDRREANGQRAMENENPLAREQAYARRRAKANQPHYIICGDVRHGPFPTRKAARDYAWETLGLPWHRQRFERVEKA